MTKSYDFGQYQVSLNGVKLEEPIDLYNADVTNAEVHLLDFWPEPGKYTLIVEAWRPMTREEQMRTGDRLPAFSAIQKITIPEDKDPEPLKIELKPYERKASGEGK